MFKPAAPSPFVIYTPPEKAMSKPTDVDENAFRAQSKSMNFGLELFKFISPAEVAIYTADGKAKAGYQGFLQNNFAWWTDAQHYFVKEANLNINKLKELDSTLSDPTAALKAQNWHDPGGYNAKSFGRTHRSTPMLSGSTYGGALIGRLTNVNPFAGLAGGYKKIGKYQNNQEYSNYNTWNRYEVTEENKQNWDYGMSQGYQSASALDNLGDWAVMNEKLDEISQQVISLKDSHKGYTWGTDSAGFHAGTDNSPWDTSTTNKWTQIEGGHTPYAQTGIAAGTKVLDDKFGSVSEKPYGNDPGKSTQAPNYFEIINSGAWSQWIKPNTTGFTTANIDGKKFYYFLKGMLESKRRGLEAYRHMLGKVELLPTETNRQLARKDAKWMIVSYNTNGSANWDWVAGQQTEDRSALAPMWDTSLKQSREQCASIKDWYTNVTDKLPAYNSYLDMIFYENTHGFFNQMQAICRSAGTSYTENEEMASFYLAATYGAYQWMTSADNPNNLTNLINATVPPTLVSDDTTPSSTVPVSVINTNKQQYIYDYFNGLTAEEKADLKITSLTALSSLLSKAGLAVPANQNREQFIPQGKIITAKLEGMQNLIKLEEAARNKAYQAYEATFINNPPTATNPKMTKEQYFGPSIKDLTRDFRKQLLTLYNEMAPIAEFYSNDATMRVPIADFAGYKNAGTNIDQLDFDYLPFSIWSSPAGGRSYDGYAQYRGFGASWLGSNNKRDGVMSIARMNPVLSGGSDMNSYQISTSAYDDGTLGQYTPNLVQRGLLRSTRPFWALSKDARDKIYGSESGKYYYGRSAYRPGDIITRGRDAEIDENPAFAGAAYSYEYYDKRKQDEVFAIVATQASLAQNRLEKNEYEEKMEDYDQAEREDAMREARMAEEARQERAREEAMIQQARERDRAQRNKR